MDVKSSYETPAARVIALVLERHILSGNDGNSGSGTAEDADPVDGEW